MASNLRSWDDTHLVWISDGEEGAYVGQELSTEAHLATALARASDRDSREYLVVELAAARFASAFPESLVYDERRGAWAAQNRTAFRAFAAQCRAALRAERAEARSRAQTAQQPSSRRKRPSSRRELARQRMQSIWRDLRDHASSEPMRLATAVLDAFLAIELFTADEHDLWTRRLRACPGHDDEGGRSWCAYCGDLERVQSET